jgi:hypothetical protein
MTKIAEVPLFLFFHLVVSKVRSQMILVLSVN